MKLRSLLLFMPVLGMCLVGCSLDNSEKDKVLSQKDKSLSQNVTQSMAQTEIHSKKRAYGTSLDFSIDIKYLDNSKLYLAKVRDYKLPIVLFSPGWGSTNLDDYSALLSFIASQGYAAIYTPSAMEYNINKNVEGFSSVLNDSRFSQFFDKSRIGIVGHSFGAGLAFKLMDYYSKHGYGENGRFVFAMDPWFSFGMSEEDYKNFPKNTNVLIQQFGSSGSTDPRIPLTIYDKLSSLNDKNKDYQYYSSLNHGYPFGTTYKSLQAILQPLDALMDYTFYNNQEAYEYALDLGSDNPYLDLQPVNNISAYDYKCHADGDTNILGSLKDINYCKIVL